MTNRLFGRATIRLDGQVLRTAKGSTLDIGGPVRTPVVDESGNTVGFTEETQPSKLDCGVQMAEGVSLANIRSIEDATVTFDCDSGQSYLINHAFCTTPPVLGGDGNAKTTFQGPPAEEIT
ncbi:MAG: hypothetical protein GC145_14365 [Caulobacter sp.]|nr:hypothetical protein [Caulobacter sp.]